MGDPAFAAGLETLVGEPFIGGNAVLPLIDGPASFAQRYALIASACQGVLVATWKVYGDHTGRKTVDALLARRREVPDLEVRVLIVDAATDRPAAITGGMNLGDEYSHAFGTEAESDPNRRRWRDTDIRIDGPAVRGDYARTVVVVPILKGVEALLRDAAAAGVPADQCQVHMRRKRRIDLAPVLA